MKKQLLLLFMMVSIVSVAQTITIDTAPTTLAQGETFTMTGSYDVSPDTVDGNFAFVLRLYNTTTNAFVTQIVFGSVDENGNSSGTRTSGSMTVPNDLTPTSELANDREYRLVASVKRATAGDFPNTTQVVTITTGATSAPKIEYISIPTEISSVGHPSGVGYGMGAKKIIVKWTNVTTGATMFNQIRATPGGDQIAGTSFTVNTTNGSQELNFGYFGGGTLADGVDAGIHSQYNGGGAGLTITEVVPVVSTITRWSGAVDTDWDTAGNWDNGVPTGTLSAVIPNVFNEPVASGTATVKDLTIQEGSSVNITGALTNGGIITVETEATFRAASATGTLVYNRTLTADAAAANAWHLVSSPVSGESVSDFINNNKLARGTANKDYRGIANYKNDGSNWNYYLFNDASGDNFDSGKGYSVKHGSANDVTFSGTYTVGPQTFGITQATNNFNLIGNPYTAYVNLGTFFTDNATPSILSEHTIWLWNPATSAYVPKTSGDDSAFEIAPGQAFFVSAGAASANVTFSLANQSHQTDTFLKNSKQEVLLNISQGDNNKTTKLRYRDGVTTSFDNGYDASMFGGVSFNLAVFTELVANNQGKKLAIQSLPASNYETMVIPVGVIASAGKEITFSASASNLPSGIKVFLEDKETGVFTRLDEANSNLKITLSEDLNGIGRFFLHTKPSVLSTNDISLENISIYKTNASTIRITGLSEGNSSVKMFNILGKQVLKNSFNTTGVKDINLPKLATGVYIVQLTTGKGKLNKKIILE